MPSILILIFVLIGSFARANICDRNFAIQEDLCGQIRKSCEDITNEDLKLVTYLYLDVYDTEAFTTDDFGGLPNVERIRISSGDQSLAFWPEDLFASFPELKRVEFRKLGFKRMPGGLFLKNKKLKEIFMSENQKLEDLPSDWLEGANELVDLTIYKSPLFSEIPDGFFQRNLTKAKHLRLMNLGISKLPEKAFSELPQLAVLQLEWNQLSEIPVSVFAPGNFSSQAQVFLRQNPLLPDTVERLRQQLGPQLIW